MLDCILNAFVCNGEVSEAAALARLDVLFKYYIDVIGMILLIKKSVLGEEPMGCADSLDGLARLYWSKGAYDEAEPLNQEALCRMPNKKKKKTRDTGVGDTFSPGFRAPDVGCRGGACCTPKVRTEACR